ncbi:MAG TPA: aspartate--ammonia ligase [Candidatus Galloscillospira stercoripullorum]|nr:aspartate--ammonia ligase [Candidatus Galloscillospira stercoripullorum]
MEKTVIPQGYAPCLNLYDTQKAIGLLKRLFEDSLCGALHLRRVSAPLFVEASTGLNDDLNGVERPVSFDIPAAARDAQVVHSLAKWKRMALHRYQFSVGEGLYTDMNAIRRDELPDNIHSVYVDQWDWEKVIAPRDRTVDFLKDTVRAIVTCVRQTQDTLRSVFPQLTALPSVETEVSFVTTQDLEDLWPDLSPKEREDAWVKDHPTTFLMGIGGALKSGKPHDGRAPDYDDWNLNGDILLWNGVLGHAFEISSMGIRVSPESLDAQLTIAGCDDRRALPFHKMLLEGKLPLTIGGGIGQSRLSMFLLGKAHIGEVQASVWDQETLDACRAAGVILL